MSSQAGIGSTFAFFVKVRKALAITPGREKRASALAKAITTAIRPSELAILVVEDNLVNQKVLCKQLHTLGCTVYVANHGVQALDFIKTTTFWRGAAQGVPLSVVLMDIEMPIMDGLTCTRAIRALQKQGSIIGHVPIIAVSANARGEQQAAAKAAGVVRCRLLTTVICICLHFLKRNESVPGLMMIHDYRMMRSANPSASQSSCRGLGG